MNLKPFYYAIAQRRFKLNIEAQLFPVDIAMRNKLAQINFFRVIAYEISYNSTRIKFFYRGEMIWEEYIPELLKVSNRGLIEMYKFKVNRYNKNR